MKILRETILQLGWREVDGQWVSPSGGLWIDVESLGTTEAQVALANRLASSVSRLLWSETNGPARGRQEAVVEYKDALYALVAQTPQLGYVLHDAARPSVAPVIAIEALVRKSSGEEGEALGWARHMLRDLRAGFWTAFDWYKAGVSEVAVVIEQALLVQDHTNLMSLAKRELDEASVRLPERMAAGQGNKERKGRRDTASRGERDWQALRGDLERVRNEHDPEKELDLALRTRNLQEQRWRIFRFAHGGILPVAKELLVRARTCSARLKSPARAELLLLLARASELTPDTFRELKLNPTEFPGELAYALSQCQVPVCSSDIETVASSLPMWSAAQGYVAEARQQAAVFVHQKPAAIWER